jgi:hypothetical protein
MRLAREHPDLDHQDLGQVVQDLGQVVQDLDHQDLDQVVQDLDQVVQGLDQVVQDLDHQQLDQPFPSTPQLSAVFRPWEAGSRFTILQAAHPPLALCQWLILHRSAVRLSN